VVLVCYRLAVGTAHGFGVVDYAQKKSVFEKCTLGPPGDAHFCTYFMYIYVLSVFGLWVMN